MEPKSAIDDHTSHSHHSSGNWGPFGLSVVSGSEFAHGLEMREVGFRYVSVSCLVGRLQLKASTALPTSEKPTAHSKAYPRYKKTNTKSNGAASCVRRCRLLYALDTDTCIRDHAPSKLKTQNDARFSGDCDPRQLPTKPLQQQTSSKGSRMRGWLPE